MKLKNKKFIAVFMGIAMIFPCYTSFAAKCNYCGKEAGRNKATGAEVCVCDRCWVNKRMNSHYYCQQCRCRLNRVEHSFRRTECCNCKPSHCVESVCENKLSRDDYERMEMYCLQHRSFKCVKCGCIEQTDSSLPRTYCHECRFLLGIKNKS